MRLGCIILLIVSSIACLSGCWSRNELNELAIVVGMGIDRADDGYKVTVQVVNPSQVTAQKGSSSTRLQPVVTYSSHGETIPEALRRMTILSSKRLYYSHLRVIILGEKLARSGIGDILDYISREPEMRNDFYFLVAKGTIPEEILSTFSATDPIPANNLFTMLDNSDKIWAATGQITLDGLLRDLLQIGKSPTLTAIRIIGSKHNSLETGVQIQEVIEPTTFLEYSGMAAFRGDRMIGWLNGDQTKALNYLQNGIRQTLGVAECPDGGIVSLAVTSSETKVIVERNDDKPIFHVKIRLEQNIADTSCDLDMTRKETMDILLESGRKKLEMLLYDGIDYAQKELRSDIFGFGEEVHRQQPEMWHKIKDWNEAFSHSVILIQTDMSIRKMGSVTQSVRAKTVR